LAGTADPRLSPAPSAKSGSEAPLNIAKFASWYTPNFVSRRNHLSQNQHSFVSSFSQLLASVTLLVCSVATGMAQHTVVEKNGLNGSIETDYNAAGKATEMRTMGADGKLQQRVDYEYLAGFYVAQQTNTTYWPSGQLRRVARNTYDESANFTGEFIQAFEESGKQIGGHNLTHDPWTGVYRCSEWNVAAQDYRAIDCPSGEEERGGAEKLKTFTYDEVMKNLEAARGTAQREQKIGPMQPKTPIHPPITSAQKEVGLVLPAQLRPGERVSGTVVENPDQYSEMPGVTVTRVAVPFESTGEASRLAGWLFETAGEEPRRADGPITLVVPRRGSGLNITLRQTGNPAHSVSQTLNFPQFSERKSLPLNSFQAPALCLKGELCVVSGPFSGDSGKTFAAFEDRPATIVAETANTAYLGIPEPTGPGARPLFIAEGLTVAALPVVVGKFVIKNNGRDLQAGETLITFPTLNGPEDIPDPAWQIGNFPATNLQRAQQLIPGFQLSQGGREARERLEAHEKGEPKEKGEIEEEKQEGEILLVVQNITQGQISLRSSRNEVLVFHLSDEAFRRGEFKYDLLVEAKKAGKVEVKGYVIPFLAPVDGQEFSIKAAR
jgi:hypothetical protein